jgi:transposase
MTKTRARVLMPNRGQMELRASDLESLLAEGHRARLVWVYVERQDLKRFYADIRVLEGGVGRAAIAPEILLSLWLYATLDGVGSGREASRLTQAHDAYRWLCGGVQVNHHTLSDFRKDHGEALDELLSVSIASLIAASVVKLKAMAQDGMRVRASAGAGSLRRKEKLEGYLDAARAEVARLKMELEADPAQAERAREAARRRAAREREARLAKALERLPELEEIKKRQGKKPDQARASMVEQVTERCGRTPASWLVDGGYVGHDQIDRVSETTVVYGPVPEPRDKTVDPHQAKASDSQAVAAWRERMDTDEAKDIYKTRAATAECVNAQSRNRGLQQFRVRGLPKVKCVMLIFALAHNLMRMAALAPELLGIGTGTSAVPG